MADQIERLIEAVNEVRNYITRLSTYSHIVNMGKAGISIVSGVSGTVGVMLVRYFLGGATMSSSGGASGAMNISKQLEGSGDGYGLVPDTNMDISRQLSGSVTGVSGLASVAISYNGQSKSLAGVVSCETIVGHADLKIL